MRVTFLGVGEACDERYPNTSLLIGTSTEIPGGGSVLLDCGFTVPPLLWPYLSQADDLAAVWISHFHGDHFFGLPALLLRLWEIGRLRPLTVLGQRGIADLVTRTMALAYPGFLDRLAFPLEYVELEPGVTHHGLGWRWRTAVGDHGQRCLALRLDGPEGSVFYSGDGRPTEATLALAGGCRLLVHEAFVVDAGAVRGHGSIAGCLEFARAAGAERLALVHLQRQVRRTQMAEARTLMQKADGFKVLLPEPGEWMNL